MSDDPFDTPAARWRAKYERLKMRALNRLFAGVLEIPGLPTDRKADIVKAAQDFEAHRQTGRELFGERK